MFLAGDLDHQLRVWDRSKPAWPDEAQVPIVGSHPGSHVQPTGLSQGDRVHGSWAAKQQKAFNSSWLVATTTAGELRGGSGMGYPGLTLARVVSLTTSVQIIISSV